MSLAAFKGTALGIPAVTGTVSGYVNRSGGTAAVFVVRTLLSSAVNVDFFATAALCKTVLRGIITAFAETAAAGFIGSQGIFADNIDFTLGTEFIFVIYAGCCRTSENCHSFVLLFLNTVVVCAKTRKICIVFATNF
jgi:hypothetical protein